MIKVKEQCDEFIVEDGKKKSCQKKNYWSENNQEFWEHAGGHLFSEDGFWNDYQIKIDQGWHFDNKALLSFQPAESHAPEDCDKAGFCSWRKS